MLSALPRNQPLKEAAEKVECFFFARESDYCDDPGLCVVRDHFFNSREVVFVKMCFLRPYFAFSCSIFTILFKFATKNVTAVCRVMLS